MTDSKELSPKKMRLHSVRLVPHACAQPVIFRSADDSLELWLGVNGIIGLADAPQTLQFTMSVLTSKGEVPTTDSIAEQVGDCLVQLKVGAIAQSVEHNDNSFVEVVSHIYVDPESTHFDEGFDKQVTYGLITVQANPKHVKMAEDMQVNMRVSAQLLRDADILNELKAKFKGLAAAQTDGKIH